MNSFLIVSIISILSATCIVCLKACYASKCENISLCWGLLNVSREVEYENPEMHEAENINTPTQLLRQKKNAKNDVQEVVHSLEEVV